MHRWEFADPDRNASGHVVAFGGGEALSVDQEGAVATPWELSSSGEVAVAYTAVADNGDQVTVSAFGSDDAKYEAFLSSLHEFMNGLRIGRGQDHPAGAFDPSVDGTLVATTAGGMTVQAGTVADYLCWTAATATSSSGDCVQDPFVERPENPAVLSDGIAVLSLGATGIPTNYTEPDAPIETLIVHLVGITAADSMSVTITLSTGEIFEVPTGDRIQALGLRFFAFQTAVGGEILLEDVISSIAYGVPPDQ
jgi:hypothetical protein